MENESQIGKQQKGRVPTIWRAFNKWTDTKTLKPTIEEALVGSWPEDVPPVFKDLYTKTTVSERLLWRIFKSYPSIQEIQARPDDYVARKEAERDQERRVWLITKLGEPEGTMASLEELKVKYANTLEEQFRQIVDVLTPRESKVLQLRFGLTDGKTLTLRQIGEEIGRSSSTVSRIEKRALAKFTRSSSHKSPHS